MTLGDVNVVVTGASMGLGAAIAEELVRQGASVLLCARGVEALTATATRLREMAHPSQIVAATPCDVTGEAQVDALRDEALRLFPHVHALIANAGANGPYGAIEDVDWEEWKHTLSINLFGMVYPVRQFLPYFKAQGRGKIVLISGGGATSPLPFVSSYAASKAAVVRFGETLASEVKAFGIDVNAIAPGVLNTRMTQQMLKAGTRTIGKRLFSRITKMMEDGESAMCRASELAAFLCSSASDGITGRLISAVWDPWPDLQKHRRDLEDSDIYTLRRIIPADRGKDWGD